MGRSCGRAIVYRRLNTLSPDVESILEKRYTYAWQKKMHIIEHLDKKGENPLQLCM